MELKTEDNKVHPKFLHFKLKFISIVLLLILNQCSKHNGKINIRTYAAEPHIAWNGECFGIIYYAGQIMSYPVNISMALVDKNGQLIKEIKVPNIEPEYKFYGRLSKLIWNERHQHFAFAFASDEKITIFRYDRSLNLIDQPNIIRNNKGDILTDVSLTYNSNLDEYGLAFICRPNMPGDKQYVLFANFDPATGQSKRDCENDCSILIKGNGIVGAEKTSLYYDSVSCMYALSYFNNKRPFVHFFSKPEQGTGIQLTQNEIMPESIDILAIPETDNFIIMYIDNEGNFKGNIISVADSSIVPFDLPNRIDRKISTLNRLNQSKGQCILTVSENEIIRTYIIDSSGKIRKKLKGAGFGKYSFEPSSCTLNNIIYITWIQNKHLCFESRRL